MSTKKDLVDISILWEKCFQKKSMPKDMIPDLTKLVENKRVDLFPENFGLNSKGIPEGGFWTFVHDEVFQQKFFELASRMFEVDLDFVFQKFLQGSCHTHLYFFEELETHKILNVDNKSFRESVETIRRCLENKEVVRISVIKYFLTQNNKINSSHAFSLVIRPGKKGKAELTVLDPSLKKSDIYTFFETFFSSLGVPVKLVIPAYACPVSLQGDTDICAIWSLYMILTHLVNPVSWWPRIEEYLLNLSSKERERLILQFSWWFYKNFMDVPFDKKSTYAEILKGMLMRNVTKRRIPKW
jgi:hypothetical protein